MMTLLITMFDEEDDENICSICGKELVEGSCSECVGRIEDLKKSKDYSKLMEISTYSEADAERHMALAAIVQIAEKEKNKEIIDRITSFLGEMVSLNKFPNKTSFGEKRNGAMKNKRKHYLIAQREIKFLQRNLNSLIYKMILFVKIFPI